MFSWGSEQKRYHHIFPDHLSFYGDELITQDFHFREKGQIARQVFQRLQSFAADVQATFLNQHFKVNIVRLQTHQVITAVLNHFQCFSAENYVKVCTMHVIMITFQTSGIKSFWERTQR